MGKLGQNPEKALIKSGILPGSRTESGQSIVIFVLALVVLIGFTALVIDGGYFYWQRQIAQNAADAGALAGATELCSSESAWLDSESLEEFARDKASALVTANNATQAEVSFGTEGTSDLDPDTIHVTAQVQFETFFGGVIGVDNLTASASASAVCTPAVQAEGPLPISMACRGEPGSDKNCNLAFHDEDGCQIGDDLYYIFLNLHEGAPNISCSSSESGTVDCNAANLFIVENEIDGVWLDLDTSGTPPNDWLNSVYHRFPGSLEMGTLYREQQTISSSYFQYLRQNLRQDPVFGDVLPLPIYDRVETSGHDLPGGVLSPEHNDYRYEVSSIAAFRVSCVHDSGENNDCPGVDWLKEQDSELDTTQFDAVEGCFTRSPVLGPRGVPETDSGAYNVTLVK